MPTQPLKLYVVSPDPVIERAFFLAQSASEEQTLTIPQRDPEPSRPVY